MGFFKDSGLSSSAEMNKIEGDNLNDILSKINGNKKEMETKEPSSVQMRDIAPEVKKIKEENESRQDEEDLEHLDIPEEESALIDEEPVFPEDEETSPFSGIMDEDDISDDMIEDPEPVASEPGSEPEEPKEELKAAVSEKEETKEKEPVPAQEEKEISIPEPPVSKKKPARKTSSSRRKKVSASEDTRPCFSLPPDVSVKGDIEVTGSVYIEGNFKGSITSSDTVILNAKSLLRLTVTADEITVGEKTRTEGDLSAKSLVMVYGAVKGNIHSDGDVVLSDKAIVTGDVEGKNISVSENASVLGNIRFLRRKDVDMSKIFSEE